MARSLALREPLAVAAAAATGWLALVAVLFAAVPVRAPRQAHAVRPLAAHGTGVAVWQNASRVYEELDRRVPGLTRQERTRVARAILEEAARAELAPLLVLAVIHVESRFDPRAVSPVGAVGLMQLMPPTLRAELAAAQHHDLDPRDPVANVRAGVRYLGRLVAIFSDVELALVAYNAGPGALRRHLGAGGVPERLRAYPREVLRAVVRLGSGAEAAPSRVALASAHAPPSPVRSEALASETPAPAPTRAPRAGEVVAALVPPPLAAWCRACAGLDFALPMRRGRDRTGAEGARSAALA